MQVRSGESEGSSAWRICARHSSPACCGGPATEGVPCRARCPSTICGRAACIACPAWSPGISKAARKTRSRLRATAAPSRRSPFGRASCATSPRSTPPSGCWAHDAPCPSASRRPASTASSGTRAIRRLPARPRRPEFRSCKAPFPIRPSPKSRDSGLHGIGFRCTFVATTTSGDPCSTRLGVRDAKRSF